MPKPRPKVKKMNPVENQEAAEATEVDSEAKTVGNLRWNDDRDEALVAAIRDNPEATYGEIAEILAANPAFEGVEVTAFKVRNQRSRIAKAAEEAGFRIPQARRSVGGRRVYATNVDRISRLFE